MAEHGPIPPAPVHVMPPADFESFLLRVGQMNYAWTNTESLLIHLIAGMVPTDKETATILHLTLNTSRARLDLVDRLAKRDGCPLPPAARKRVLGISRKMKTMSGLRNQLNHCIYAFDADGGPVRAIQMRIADRKHSLRMGEEKALDSATMGDLDAALDDIRTLNREIWALLSDYRLPV